MAGSKGVLCGGLLYLAAVVTACTDAPGNVTTELARTDPATVIFGPCDPSVSITLKSDWSRAPAWYIFGYPATKRIWVEGTWNGQRARVLETKYVTNVLLGDRYTFLPWGRSEFPDSGLATAYFNGGSVTLGDDNLEVQASVEVQNGAQLPRTACRTYSNPARRGALTRVAQQAVGYKLLLGNSVVGYSPRFMNVDVDTLPPDSVRMDSTGGLIPTRTGRETFSVYAAALGVHTLTAHLGSFSAQAGTFDVCGTRDQHVSLSVAPDVVTVGRGSTFVLTTTGLNCAGSAAFNAISTVTPSTAVTLTSRTMVSSGDRLTYRANEFGTHVVRISRDGVSDSTVVTVLPQIPIVTGAVVLTNRAQVSWGSTGVTTYRVYRTTSNSTLRQLAWEGSGTSWTDLTQTVSSYTQFAIPSGSWVGYEVVNVVGGVEGGASYRHYFAASKTPRF